MKSIPPSRKLRPEGDGDGDLDTFGANDGVNRLWLNSGGSITDSGVKGKGLVLNLERFAIHDGPGIRTLVFMKGCSLKCVWCSTPHSQKASSEILHNELRCKQCGRCVEVCSLGAIILPEDGYLEIDREVCNVCGQCIEECPNDALELMGKWMTVGELFWEVEKDSPFYRRSNGGVTVGGGEPIMQLDFVTAFLKRCKQSYIHTAIETCGFVKWERFQKMLDYVDLVYLDVKHMDDAAHRELTGVSNQLILENSRRASAMRPMIIRIPVVPSYNDSDDNILATARFAAGLGENLKRVELLPYHKFGIQIYSRLGREYKLKDVEPPSDDHMKRLKEIVESCGIRAKIGG